MATLDGADQCTLRIIAINDIYELQNLPRFRTCIEKHRTPNTIVTCAGDFLMPSLLSAIDKGKAMVDVMNKAGVQYVCIGNHESNVTMTSLLQRYDESNFTWINSNMPDVNLRGRPKMPEYVTITVQGTAISKTVALLGINTNEAKLYSPKAFGGAPILDPLDTAKRYAQTLASEVDCIVPLTHLSIRDDRLLAQMELGFPISLGGHDHDLYHEIVQGQHILKLGQNATHFGIVDLTWRADRQTPIVTVQVHDAQLYEPDPEVVACVEDHLLVLEGLKAANLVPFPVGERMSSIEVRKQPATMGTFLCTAAREALSADCCVYKAGYIRGNTDYSGQKYLSYADLVGEVGLDRIMNVIPVPGSVISEMATYGRTGPRVDTGEYLQFDNQMVYDLASDKLTHIAGQPVDPDRTYDLAIPFKAIMSIEPLTKWARAHPEIVPDSEESGVTMTVILVNYWSATIWLQLGQLGTLEVNENGVISANEVKKALTSYYPTRTCSIVYDNLMAVADENGDGVINMDELLQCALKCAQWDLLDTNSDGVITMNEFSQSLSSMLHWPIDLTEEQLRELFETIDADGSGTITKAELRSWISGHRTKAIGIARDVSEIQRPKTTVYL